MLLLRVLTQNWNKLMKRRLQLSQHHMKYPKKYKSQGLTNTHTHTQMLLCHLFCAQKVFSPVLQNVALQLLTVLHLSCALYSFIYNTSSIVGRKKHITLSVLTRQAAQNAAWLLLPVCCWAKGAQKRLSLTHVSCSL